MPVAEPTLISLLPEVLQVSTSGPLQALDVVAADFLNPVAGVLADLDRVVDPFRTPDALMPYLSSWVDLDWLTLTDPDATAQPVLAGGVVPLRDLVAASADLAARRGTAGGLTRFLQLATGVPGFSVTEGPQAFHVVVTVPIAAGDQMPVVRRIVQVLKPAHVTAEVVLGDVERAASVEIAAAATPADESPAVDTPAPTAGDQP